MRVLYMLATIVFRIEKPIILLGLLCAFWFLLVTIGNECFWFPERCDWEYIERELREQPR